MFFAINVSLDIPNNTNNNSTLTVDKRKCTKETDTSCKESAMISINDLQIMENGFTPDKILKKRLQAQKVFNVWKDKRNAKYAIEEKIADKSLHLYGVADQFSH